MTQTALLGALYAEDFDAPACPPAPPKAATPPAPPVIIPVFTAADLAAAREEGRAAGRLEVENGLAASRVQMLGVIATGIGGGDAACAEAAERTAEATARIMLSALAACLPTVCIQHGETELRALARALLPGLTDEKRIIVRVHPLMVAGLTAELAALDPDIAACVTLVPSDQIPPGDGRITWEDGSANRDAGRARAAVEDALAALGLLEKEMADA